MSADTGGSTIDRDPDRCYIRSFRMYVVIYLFIQFLCVVQTLICGGFNVFALNQTRWNERWYSIVSVTYVGGTQKQMLLLLFVRTRNPVKSDVNSHDELVGHALSLMGWTCACCPTVQWAIVFAHWGKLLGVGWMNILPLLICARVWRAHALDNSKRMLVLHTKAIDFCSSY